MTLTEFLLARIAEDKARVASLTDDDWESEFGWQGFNGTEEPFLSAVLAFKPSRVLAECEAKRAIVELHKPTQFGWHPELYCWNCTHEGIENYVEYPCDTLKLVAMPYADHPDYPPEFG